MFINGVLGVSLHITVSWMGLVRLMGSVLFYASCEIIFLIFNDKIGFSFVDAVNINLLSSSKKKKKPAKINFQSNLLSRYN